MMYGFGAVMAVSAIMSAQNDKYLKAFYRAGATDESKAIPLESVAYKDKSVIQRLVMVKMLAEKNGHYYITEKYVKSMRRKMARKER